MHHVSSLEYEILKYIDKNSSIDLSELSETYGIHEPHILKSLVSKGYIKDIRSMTSDSDKAQALGLYRLTPEGVTLLKSHYIFTKKDNFRFWFPVTISFLALLLSFIALIISVL